MTVTVTQKNKLTNTNPHDESIYYLPNGYIDFSRVLEGSQSHTLLVVARGTGKTYGAIKYMIDNKILHFFLRRNQIQVDIIGSRDFSPYLPIFDDMGRDFFTERRAKIAWDVYEGTEADKAAGTERVIETHIGTIVALSSIRHLRGFSAPNHKYLILDEAIPEIHEKQIQHEGEAFLNAFETINRNRELNGEKPLKSLLLGNSNYIEGSLLYSLDAIPVLDRMAQKKLATAYDATGKLKVVKLDNSPISAQKKETSMYRGGSAIDAVALGNRFGETDAHVKRMPLREYTLICKTRGIGIYQHKSTGKYYVSETISGGAEDVRSGADFIAYIKRHPGLKNAVFYNEIIYENRVAKILFEFAIELRK